MSNQAWRGRFGFLGRTEPPESALFVVHCPQYGVFLSAPEPRSANECWTNDLKQAIYYTDRETAEIAADMRTSLGFECVARCVVADVLQEDQS